MLVAWVRHVFVLCLDSVPNEHVYGISTGEATPVSCPFVRSIFLASLLQTELICFISFTNRASTGPANEDILTQYLTGSQNRSGFSNYVFKGGNVGLGKFSSCKSC